MDFVQHDILRSKMKDQAAGNEVLSSRTNLHTLSRRVELEVGKGAHGSGTNRITLPVSLFLVNDRCRKDGQFEHSSNQ